MFGPSHVPVSCAAECGAELTHADRTCADLRDGLCESCHAELCGVLDARAEADRAALVLAGEVPFPRPPSVPSFEPAPEPRFGSFGCAEPTSRPTNATYVPPIRAQRGAR